MVAQSRLLLAELSREDTKAIAEEGLLLLPVGSTEQHGPHLPVGMDAMGAEHVTIAAAKALGPRIPIAVAPTLWYGTSPHHVPFGGTMSLKSTTFYHVLMDLGSSLAEGGFRRLFMVNGHGGNHELVSVAARDLALAYPLEVGACSWWALAYDELVAAGALETGKLPGHAGGFETSIMMTMDSSLVQELPPERSTLPATPMKAFRGDARFERPGKWQAIDGYTDNPNQGSAEQGRRFLEVSIDKLVTTVSEFYRGSRPGPLREEPGSVGGAYARAPE